MKLAVLGVQSNSETAFAFVSVQLKCVTQQTDLDLNTTKNG